MGCEPEQQRDAPLGRLPNTGRTLRLEDGDGARRVVDEHHTSHEATAAGTLGDPGDRAVERPGDLGAREGPGGPTHFLPETQPQGVSSLEHRRDGVAHDRESDRCVEALVHTGREIGTTGRLHDAPRRGEKATPREQMVGRSEDQERGVTFIYLKMTFKFTILALPDGRKPIVLESPHPPLPLPSLPGSLMSQKSPDSPGKRTRRASAKKPRASKKAPATKKATASRSASSRSRAKTNRKRPARKRTPRKKGPVTTPVRAIRSWRAALALEAATWGAGVVAGLAITGALLWMRAKSDVTTYLADPPRTIPGVVWSAPIDVQPGQAASVSALAGDLLAAGYERVRHVDPAHVPPDGPGEFAVLADGLDIYTQPWPGVEGGRTRLRIVDGTVVEGAPATLRPTVLATVGDWDGRRTDVHLDRVSPFLEPALLSMEDQRFREHMGIDPWGIVRAGLKAVVGNGGQGGSTLTQQLAKNLFLTPERTLRRKVREVFFAAALESELSKDELLELYLREVYLGQMGGVPLVGVEAASRAWFGVSADHLSLDQAATIIGVIPAPNAYSPRRHPERAEQRRNLVIEQMVKVGAITGDQATSAKQRPLTLGGALPGAIRRAPWAVDLAVDDAERHIGEGALAGKGYHVHTSIQPVLQRVAEEAVALGAKAMEEEYRKARGAQVALVAVDAHTGGIVAMVGSRSYGESPFNRAASARRQAGSTVKPLTLLAAFDEDPSLTPLTRISDAPITRRIDGRSWTPKNYDGRFMGDITVRRAIETSRNIPAVLLAEEVGATDLQQFYRTAGLTFATNLPSASLGGFEVTPLEMAGAYTVFPGGGTLQEPWMVDRIGEPNGAEVLALEHHTEALSSARAARLASSVLEGVIERGTGMAAKRYGVEGGAGGKTGTTSDYRDAWFVGFTDDLAVAVWVGRDEGSLGLPGSRAALPIWARFVAASGTLGDEDALPEGLVEARVCENSGRIARPQCEHTYLETFPEGGVPKEKCDVHGGPIVEAGRALGRLFSGKKKDDEVIE